MIKRFYLQKLDSFLKPNKVLIIYGPRQVGKTTLVKEFLQGYKGKIYMGSGDNISLQTLLNSQDFSKILPYFRGYDLIFIDEAQNIKNVGLGLKIIVDNIPNIKVIATGSSSFELANKVGEPLVGRQRILRLYPISVMELIDTYGAMYIHQNLNNLLVYGAYPEVITTESFEDKIDLLRSIRDSYLLKDILALQEIKYSKKLLDLLKLIAYQIGHEVSLHELANTLDLSKNTVAKYLELLEKAFVLINVRGFSRNLRNEITKTSRYYFYDLGIRNAIIENFNDFDSRNDKGQLWENFLFIERLKRNEYKRVWANYYFWRTYSRQEIDLIEERNGKLYAYEFKWNAKKANKMPPSHWQQAYSDSEWQVITPENFLDFVI